MISPYSYVGIPQAKQHPNKKLTIEFDELVGRASKCFDVPPELVVSKSRKRSAVYVRMVLYAILKERGGDYDYSLVKIGKLFCGRDHATIISALREHRDLMDTDEYYNKNYKSFYMHIYTGSDFQYHISDFEAEKRKRNGDWQIKKAEIQKLCDCEVGESFEILRRDYHKVLVYLGNRRNGERFTTTRLAGEITRFTRVK